jgi:cell division protein FtsW
MLYTKSSLKTDASLIATIALLGITGLLVIASISSVAAEMAHHDASYFTRKHLIGMCMATIVLITVRAIPYRYVIRAYPLLYICSALATLATHSRWGIAIHGSARWLNLGFIVVQPSELLKISTIIILALILYRHQYALWSPANILLFGGTTLMSMLLLLSQPDFGQAMTIALSAVTLLIVARIPWSVIIAGIGSLAGLGIMLAIWSPYRLKRLLIFMDPWSDEHGKGFQVIQSLIALGSGGWTGVGIGQSQQKYGYLPMLHTDFIAAGIGEEFGLMGMILLMTLYIILTHLFLKRAHLVAGSGLFVIVAGVVLINIQALFHMGVVTSCLPPKGIGLPLVSYGTSSLLAYALLLGTMLCPRPAINTSRSYLVNR